MLIHVSLRFLITFLILSFFASPVKSEQPVALEIPDVFAFPMYLDGGAMPIAALKAVLDYHGIRISLPVLMGVSGKAFTFVYDSSPIREPQRDLYPLDFYQNIMEFLGISGKWVANSSRRKLVPIILENLKAKSPLLSPNVIPDGYMGYYIITGYNKDTKQLLLQGTTTTKDNQLPYLKHSMQNDWFGPTTNSLHWAKNPIYTITITRDRSSAKDRQWVLHSLERAADILRTDRISYEEMTMEGKVLKGRFASHGFVAYDALEQDIRSIDHLMPFEKIWRITVQMTQLESARSNAGKFFEEISILLPVSIRDICELLTSQYQRIVNDAAFIRSVFWSHITSTDPDRIIREMKAAKAFIYSVDTPEMGQEKIKQTIDGKWLDTEWGSCMFITNEALKHKTLETVRTMKKMEKVNLQKIEELIETIEMLKSEN